MVFYLFIMKFGCQKIRVKVWQDGSTFYFLQWFLIIKLGNSGSKTQLNSICCVLTSFEVLRKYLSFDKILTQLIPNQRVKIFCWQYSR